MELNFKWKEKTASYQTGESLYLNIIRVASYGWNSGRSKAEKDNSKDWVGHITLPQAPGGIYGKDQDEIKAKIECIVINWFKVVAP